MFKKLLFIAILVPQMAFAGFSLNPTYGIYRADSDENMSQIELRIGYTFDFGLFVGGFYSLGSQNLTAGQEGDEYLLGPMVGYQFGGLYGLLGYALGGEQDMKSGGIKYGSADGMLLTMGYRMLVAPDVYLGPEITYRSIKYDDKETQGLPTDVDREDKVVIPSIGVLFAF